MQRVWQLLFCALMTGSMCSSSSGQTFSRRYDSYGNGQPQDGWSIEALGNGGAMVFATSYDLDSNFFFLSISALKLAANGDTLHASRTRVPWCSLAMGWSNASCITVDSGYIVGAGKQDTTGALYPSLARFDANGDTLWVRHYGSSGQEWIGRQAKQTPDGGYVICGETSSIGVVDAFLIKTDSAGNVQWTQTYGQPTLLDYAVAVDMVPGGGYYLGGQKDVTSSIDDPWVLRLDNAGDVIWENAYGPSIGESTNAHIQTLADSACVFGSAWPTGNGTDQILCLVKVALDGGMVWSHTYGVGTFNSTLFAVKEITPHGDLIACGQSYQESNYRKGVLLRTNADGDSLWMRHYFYTDSVMSEGLGTFRDVQPTPDGGFVAVGTAYGSAGGNNPPGYNQDVWVVKVDSMGCLEPGCDALSVLTTQITNYRNALSIAPNPAHGSVQLTWDLPAALRAKGRAELSIVSAQGALVRTEPLDLSGNGITLDVEGLAPGLYHLHVVQAGTWVTGGKLVVE